LFAKFTIIIKLITVKHSITGWIIWIKDYYLLVVVGRQVVGGKRLSLWNVVVESGVCIITAK